MKPFDPYHNTARFMPLLLALLPLVPAITLWWPGALKWTAGLGSGGMVLALSFLGAQFARQAGKSKEQALWASWNGQPTTRFLRHGNTEFNSFRRARCHANMQRWFPDLRMPTVEEQRTDPALADEIYAAGVERLIGLTRDTGKHQLLYKENVTYGFLRNLWGLKTLGMTLAGLGLASAALKLWLDWRTADGISGEEVAVVTCVLSAVAFLFWMFWVRPEKIRVPAEGYARHLLEFCEQVNDTSAPPSMPPATEPT